MQDESLENESGLLRNAEVQRLLHYKEKIQTIVLSIIYVAAQR